MGPLREEREGVGAPAWGVWLLEVEEGANPSQIEGQLTAGGQWGEWLSSAEFPPCKERGAWRVCS